MAIIGIALLGFLLLAVIGKRAAQTLLKGIGVVLGLVIVYLAVGSQIVSQPHPAQPVVLTPEQIANDPTNTYVMIGLGIMVLVLVVRFAFVVRRPHGPPTRLGYGPPRY